MKLNQVRAWTRGGTRKTAHRVSPRKISSPRQKFGRLAESIKIGTIVIFASEKNIKAPKIGIKRLKLCKTPKNRIKKALLANE